MARLLLLLLAAAAPGALLAQQHPPQQQQRLRAPTFEATNPGTTQEQATPAAPVVEPRKAGGAVGAAPVAPVLPIPKGETPACTFILVLICLVECIFERRFILLALGWMDELRVIWVY